MRVTAAVTEATGSPFVLQELELDEPRPDEITVRMVAAGICHSDLSARDQFVPIPLPVVLGHEGAGVVDSVGTAVTKLAVGDRVVLSRLTCGTCEDCVSGRSNFCPRQGLFNFSGARPDGSTGLSRDGRPVGGQFFGQSSFATYALAHERNATKLDADFDLSIAPAFACGVLTGAGAVLNGLRVQAGTAIAVFGAGSVGMAAILAAKVSGCTTIIAVDRIRSRLDLAAALGATHTVLAADTGMVEQIRAIVPVGVHYCIEATGVPAVARSAVESLRPGGRCGLLGVGPPGTTVTFGQYSLLTVGVIGLPTGVSQPEVLVPRLVELYQQGRFPVDRLVTTFKFDEIQHAAELAERGTVVKPILLFS